MIHLDLVEVVKVIHHDPRRLLPTLGGQVGSPVQAMQMSAIAEAGQGELHQSSEPDEIIERIKQLEAAGLTHFAFQLTDDPVGQLQYFAETVMRRYH